MLRSHFICVLKWVFLSTFMFGVECTIEKLKCYQCEVRDASLCTDEYLQPCPDNQAYDRCITRVYKTKDDQPWIHKSCALAPCSLSGPSATGLGMDHCDRSQEEYDCISCCKDNGCNTGDATALHSIPALVVALGFLVHVAAKRFGLQ